MKDIFLALSALIAVGSVIPYVRNIIRGTTKPNLVTWMTWTLLTGIATAAELAGGEMVTAIYTGAITLSTLLVVVVGLRRGFVSYTRFDAVCQFAAIAGIIIWQLFDSPTIAVWATISIDLVGALPTIRHAWYAPGEETWQTYAITTVSGVFAVAALTSYTVLSMSYPLYLIITDTLIAALIVLRHGLRTS